MNGLNNRDLSPSILEKFFTENGIDGSEVEEMGQKPNSIFDNVHLLITSKCQRLSELNNLEKTPFQATKSSQNDTPVKSEPRNETFPDVVPNKQLTSESESEDQELPESDLDYKEDGKDYKYNFTNHVIENSDFNSRKPKSNQINFILLKHNKKFHCSECYFKTGNHQAFESHFSQCHVEEAKRAYSVLSIKPNQPNSGSGVRKLYLCRLCKFVTFNVRGFKIHSSSTHNSYNNKKTFRCLPASNKDALKSYQNYLASLNLGQRRRNAIDQFRSYFSFCDLNVGLERNHVPKEAYNFFIPCMRCQESFVYPSLLVKHYNESHFASGPCRKKTDHEFHCMKCSFSSKSYKSLHRHFADNHSTLNLGSRPTVYVTDSDESTDQERLNINDSVSQKNISTTELNSPEKNVEIVGQDSEDTKQTDYVLQCEKCNIQTPTICKLLNHYRGSHNRNYPEFAEDRIIEEFKQNVVLVEIPRKDITESWMNGWINEDCTTLISEPVFKCGFCNYTCTIFNTIASHYTNWHASKCSIATVGVFEKVKQPTEQTTETYVSLHRELFKCTLCNFSACLYQTMYMHYTTLHSNQMQPKTNYDMLIHSSTTNWCFKCKKIFDEVSDLIWHIGNEHSKDVANFMQENGAFRCKFCGMCTSDLSDLAEHLESHEQQYNEYYGHNYIVAFCCSKCRRVFRAKRCMRNHYTRMHTEWTDDSFTNEEIPKHFFVERNHSNELVGASSRNSQKKGNKIMLPRSMYTSVRLENNRYICRRCQYTTTYISAIRSHLKRTHNVLTDGMPTLKSDEQEKTTSTKKLILNCSHTKRNPSVVERHVEQRHHPTSSYDCPQCNKTFICQVILIMHMRKKHKNAPFAEFTAPHSVLTNCSNKNIKSRFPLRYKQHVAAKHAKNDPFRCPKCCKAYMCAPLFAMHLKKKHNLKYSSWWKQKEKISVNEKAANFGASEAESTSKLKVTNLSKGLNNKKKMHEAKDYGHPQSVKLPNNKWKCLYCQDELGRYISLRQHVGRDHPDKEIFKCKWCDFYCKTSAKHKRHVKIHYRFIGTRMAELRNLWKKQKTFGLQSRKKAQRFQTPFDVGKTLEDEGVNRTHEEDEWTHGVSSAEETDLSVCPAEPFFQTANIFRPHQTARKSIKSSPAQAKEPATTSTQVLLDERLKEAVYVLRDGRMSCKLCDYNATIDRSRILLHLRACHTLSSYVCQLCEFNSREYKEIQKHLVEHHKSKKNHNRAIDVVVDFSKDERERLNKMKKLNGNSQPRLVRRREFEPQPSLPIITPEPIKRKHDDGNGDRFYDNASLRGDCHDHRPNGEPAAKRLTRPNKRTNGKPYEYSRFTCKYCGCELESTYEMEYHMRRHEAGVIEHQGFFGEPQLFAKLCVFSP